MAFSQPPLSITGTYQNGKSVKENDIFLKDSSCTFFIQNDSGEKIDLTNGSWKFEVQSIDLSFITSNKTTDNNEFIFSANTLDIRTNLINEIQFDGDNSVYYKAQISCSGKTVFGDDFELSFPIWLNLLPSVPMVQIKALESIPNENTYRIVINASSDRANVYRFVHKEYDGARVYTFSQCIPDPDNFQFTLSSIYEINLGDHEFYIIAQNEFGGIITDAYKFADIITAINDAKTDKSIAFYPNPCDDILHIKGSYDNIENFVIINIAGEKVLEINKLKEKND